MREIIRPAESQSVRLGRFIDNLPHVTTKDFIVHMINCPYCKDGFAEVKQPLRDRQAKMEFMREMLGKLKEPRKCVACGKHFRLKLEMKMFGVKLED